MAGIEEPHRQRSSSAGGKEIRAACADRFGKANQAQRVLRSLLPANVRVCHNSRAQTGPADTQDCSSKHLGPAARATIPDAGANGNAFTDTDEHALQEKARAKEKQEEENPQMTSCATCGVRLQFEPELCKKVECVVPNRLTGPDANRLGTIGSTFRACYCSRHRRGVGVRPN